MRHLCSMNRLIPFSGLLLAFVRVHAATEAPVPSERLQLTHPLPYQVVQRVDFDPAQAHVHGPHAAMGRGTMAVRWMSTLPGGVTMQYRAAPLPNAFGAGIDWTPLKRTGEPRAGTAEVPAGGWYRLDVRSWADGKARDAGSVEPVGVGEIFLVAGQSYADNCNDERLRVGDPAGRVVAYDPKAGAWQVAHDPQPTPSAYRDGSLWPAVGDALLPVARTPVGFANVAVAATASSAWLPGTPNHKNLVEAGKALGAFRYVLWQQGESDVIGGVSSKTYIEHLVRIRAESARAWGFEPTWLLAKSTMHPTVYHKPDAEREIRTAIAGLWNMKGFRPGPDTDLLGGENRGGPASRRHFSALGQRRAASMWFSAIWGELGAPSR
jgi:hypothetical protein